MSQPCFVYRINNEDTINFINPHWIAFAISNNYEVAYDDLILGRRLWDFIEGAPLTHLYQSAVERVRSMERSMFLTYRCDSPDRMRLLQMRIIPLPNSHIEFHNWVIKEETRAAIPLLDSDAQRNEEFIRMCSRCKAVHTGKIWTPLEHAAKLQFLFESDSLPQITHGLCPVCEELMNHEIDLMAAFPHGSMNDRELGLKKVS